MGNNERPVNLKKGVTLQCSAFPLLVASNLSWQNSNFATCDLQLATHLGTAYTILIKMHITNLFRNVGNSEQLL